MQKVHQRLAVALLTLELGACNRPAREGQEIPAEREPAGQNVAAVEKGRTVACDEQHKNQLREEMQDMCVWSSHTLVVDAPLSPWAASPHSKIRADVQIAIADGNVRLLPRGDGDWSIGNGNALEHQRSFPVNSLPTALLALRPEITDGGDPRPLAWSLQIANDVPTSTIAFVLRALADANMLDGQIVLKNPDEPPPVRIPALHARLQKARAGVAGEELLNWTKQELTNISSQCLNFDDALAATTAVEDSQACLALAGGLAVTLNDCDCEREAEVLTLMYTLTLGAALPENRAASILARITPDATPRTGETWASIVQGFGPKEEPLRIWVSAEGHER